VQAVVKAITCDEVELSSFVPSDPATFALTLRIRIGLENDVGADDFECCVCTPRWLQQVVWEPKWGRHLLIVREFNLVAIEHHIHEYVKECSGNDWISIARMVARVLAWEFEDYEQPR